MIISNYYEDNQDLQFTLKHYVNWDKIVPLKEHDFRDAESYRQTGDSALEFAPSSVAEAVEAYEAAHHQAGEIAGKELAASARAMEKHGLKFANGKVTFPPDTLRIVDLFTQSGLLLYSTHREWGGLHMPYAAQMAVLEMLSRADAAFGITLGCFNLADVIERFGDQKMKETYLPRIHSGEMTGAMALTEPNYGSDLSNILTRAVKQEDGTWLINGTKRFITHGCGIGDRPAAILTLARSGGDGARGLSFFLVESGDIQVARIEEKLGLHTSPTCEIVYENSKALLIGEEGRGLVKYAMEMMNGARLGIAVQALGIADAAYREGKKYAEERVQFGGPIANLPPVARSLREMNAIVQAMRALVYRTAEIVDLYDGLTAKYLAEGTDEKAVRKIEEVQRYDKLAKLLTPAAKYYCSELCNKVAYDSLQLFGGSGYTEEYDIAKIYRDARITTIYEGTSNMQVLAAIGPVLEGSREGGTVNNYLLQLCDRISNSQVADEFRREVKNLTGLVVVYKEKAKEVKDAVSMEVVNYFIYLFTAILLAEQLQVALDIKSADVAAEKQTALNSYLHVMRRQLASSAAMIRNYHG